MPGATTTSYSLTATSSVNGNVFEAVFTNSTGSTATQAVTLTVISEFSANWSGYVASGSDYNQVEASWYVPTVSCPVNVTAYSGQWIGIDGYSSSEVEQIGTEADCLSGSPSYDAWYEMVGDSAVNNGDEVELSPSTYPVHPGDAMSADIEYGTQTGEDVWNLNIVDSTQEWNFDSTIDFAGASRSSAEWIIERPELAGNPPTLADLADFGTTTMSGAYASDNGTTDGSIGYLGGLAVTMVDSQSNLLAIPSAYRGEGEGGVSNFTDYWETST